MNCINNVNTISVDNLTKDYGNSKGIFEVSFFVKKGECLGFLGPNGAGKSTTIRHLLGFCRPEKGSCFIKGLDPFKNRDKLFKDVGYIPGEVSLPLNITGEDFIKMQASLKGINDYSLVNKLISRFDIKLKQQCSQMSFGMKRRLAILNCFMNDPSIFILDEPTSGLDLRMQREFINLIREEKERNKTILFLSHYFNEIKNTCDRVCIIKDGRIVSEFKEDEYSKDDIKIYMLKVNNVLKSLDIVKDLDCGTVLEFNEDKFIIKMGVKVSDTNKFIDCLKIIKPIEIKDIKHNLENEFMSFYCEDKKFSGI